MLKLKKYGQKYGKSLGIAKKTRQYDLPLNKGSGGQFLMVLIALMSFLTVLALTASFALSEMTNRWTSGLENTASIEIPAEDTNGNLIETQTLEVLTLRIHTFLNTHPAVETAEVMSEEEISKLVAPWLGEDMEFSNIPLPGIISVHFKDDVAFDIESLQENIIDIAPQARLDTHESWLENVLRFTGALNFAAALVSIVIGITTIVAVGGAVQSRMAIYHDELELLHLMGASDEYITKQLQRYVFIIAFKGALIGVLSSAVVLVIIGWFMGHMNINLIPNFSLSTFQIALLALLIPFTAFIGMITARHTVLRALALMP
jgi:cell division transport system permease protein